MDLAQVSTLELTVYKRTLTMFEGGAVFPLLLQRLLSTVGFAWAVRIQGFLALACCIIATLTISSPVPKNKNTPWIDTKSFRDTKYMLVCLAYALICLGKPSQESCTVMNAD